MSAVLVLPFCEMQRAYLPMFWAGVYLKDNYQFVLKYAKQTLIISGIIFAICLFFWEGNYTVYITGFPKLIKVRELTLNPTNINISVFRLFIGLCGSLFWFMLFERIFRNNVFFSCLAKTGVNTLAIYLLQRLILEDWMNRTIDFQNMNLWIYSLLVTPLISLVIILISYFLIKIVQKNKYAEMLLFGKQR
ncbi:hypothetical protein SDC9_162234 [bioreactor metagenome]|uniref:Acyltransferase 3 domain-containing protein n=1 Tax=bioreactor metagenome TaxID=1076179 RepID=A0A645FKI8_9ZZZZ